MFPYLLFLFVVLPIAEIALLIRVAEAIQWGPTVLLVLFTGILGAALARREGVRTYIGIQQAMAEGRMPAREMLEGLLVLVAGVVLITPGVITDVAGFLLLIPPFRRWVAGRVGTHFKSRITIMGPDGRMHSADEFRPGGSHPGGAGGASGDDDIIDAEYRVVEDHDRLEGRREE